MYLLLYSVIIYEVMKTRIEILQQLPFDRFIHAKDFLAPLNPGTESSSDYTSRNPSLIWSNLSLNYTQSRMP
jgi:hypothetical protein